MRRVVFLYTEIADYLLACLQSYVENYEARVLLIKWPINSEAPFKIGSLPMAISIREKVDMSYDELSKQVALFSPDLIYCAGWRDRDYLKIVSQYYRKIPTVVGFDNQWNGTFRQILAAITSPFYLKRIFSHVWIPGKVQLSFARRLGYSGGQVMMGFYSCNHKRFERIYFDNSESKATNFPKRFIYCARYVKWKGIFELWRAFALLHEEQPNEWELWCLGTGEEFENRFEHPMIKHFGFVQPKDLGKFMAETGVYVLPSHFEPWGVSVHEFAAAGFPLILSNRVGACSQFLKCGHNGFTVDVDIDSIKNSLQKIVNMTPGELIEMGRRSHELSYSITPEKWANCLNEIVVKGML